MVALARSERQRLTDPPIYFARQKSWHHRLAKRCRPRHIGRNLARRFHQQNSGRIKAAKHMAKHVEKQIFHRPYRLESAVTCSLDRPPQNRYYITNNLNIKPLRRYLQIQRQVHCLGCSMTKAQKSFFKSLKNKQKRSAFVSTSQEQQNRLGGYDDWPNAYRASCRKKSAQDLLA